ncbi:hypothetical protein D0864_12321 [Hortaea werneckii]|uniref:Glucanase n=1 Tax=Hortaea werneckii TaxID=91943 RepID=A0A3M7DJH3_HORWE|nr:hypothetical protein D0864_12321 [Hortaea werneckii]
MHHSTALSALAFGASVMGQQAGTSTAEDPPSMPLSRCTDSGCTEEDHSVTLDANWRWTHSVDGYTNCYTGNTWDDSLCPDGETCAQNCAVDGADYSGTYGISSQNGALSLTLKTGSNVGSRVYLLGEGGENYEMFDLRNKEFAFDVDVSSLPCGVNGALYFVEMDADGGLSEYENNKAGAKYGTGYCDAQCPQDIKYINGKANVEDWTPSEGDPNSGTGSMGSCCNEMDIWEANSISTALTPHVCKKDGQTACQSDTACGVGDARNDGVCDKDGCDFNPFRMGNESYYGDGKIVDTSSKMTVVTQFITGDNSDTGELTEIRRIYKQNGNVIQQATSNVEGVSGNSITDDFCKAQKDAFGDPTSFESRGGLSAMGDAFSRGMVLVMSIWVDYAANMHWLDAPYPEDADKSEPGVARGTCSTDSGVPDDVISQSGDATVTFSNIKSQLPVLHWSVNMQMSNVFVPSVPNIGERFASESSESSDNMKTAIPRDRHDSVHAIASSTAQESRVASSRESAISSDGDDEDPLGDLERAAALESSLSTRKSASPPGNGPATGRLRDIPSTTNFPEQLHVSPPQTPAAKTEKSSSIGDNLDPEVTNPVKRCSRQSTCSTSSEEWTGDEEFLPLSVRQRHRAQRLAYRQAPESPQQASRSNAQTRAGLHRDTATPLQQSFSYENSHKASRFRTQVRVRVVGETGTLQDRKESQADKDLDDEGEKMV